MSLESRWRDALDSLREQGRERRLSFPAGIDFSSNDYLGYGKRVFAANATFSRSGAASRLLRGHHPLWDDVEAHLARWHGAEAALVFSSGYLANLGLLTTVIEDDDFVFSDAANHASIIDGLRGARNRHVYRHNDLADLETGLRGVSANRRAGSEVFIVAEALFSMDGDVAPLGALAALAEKHDAQLIVDEAHATGCFGATGAGLVDALGLRERVLATVHTGGKALGVPGAYVAGSRTLKELLVNRCRQFIFTTALPPMIAAWWLEALPRVQADHAARERLHSNARALRANLARWGVEAAGEHYIVPVRIGQDARAVAVAERLQQQGYDIRAIRPPTVPENTARLRISVHADHDLAQLEAAAWAIAETMGSCKE
jgi:8-amino-7-oxononanoate synthase